MTFCFDIDGTLCHTENGEYERSTPLHDMIMRVNGLHNSGHTIKLYTSRGMTRYRGMSADVYAAFYDMTHKQLTGWGVQFDELIMAKPSYDVFVDDRNMTIEGFKRSCPLKVGFVAGAFDIIHPGYVAMFKEAKENCDSLTVALHVDPSLERPEKRKPVFSQEERTATLLALQYVDKVISYDTEMALLEILEKEPMDIRFLGDDYRGKEHLGFYLNTPIHYIDRGHGWSYSKAVECLNRS